MSNDVSSAAPRPSAAQLSGLLLASVGAVFFSGKAIVAKLLYQHGSDAVTVIGLRMLLSVPFFIAVAIATWRSGPKIGASDFARIVALGLLGYWASSMLDFMGLQYISAGLERLILFLTPSFVLLLGVLAFKRKVSRMQWFSLLFAYAGIVLVFWHDVNLGGSAVILGSGLVMASALCYALYLLLSGEVVRRIGPMRLVALVMPVSCVACLIQYALLRPWPTLFMQSAPVWGLSLVNATACTVLPVFLTMSAVARVGPGTAAQAGMIGPVSTVFLAYWLLGEPIGVLQMAGTGLVLAGIWLLSRQKAPAGR
ncbi:MULTISPECIES: DMT family transporter [Hydrocarboniphaga]|uniref:Drug/metabolite transporter (DMT) superfamily permease n=1 Tax=Hydrocarboniphaga effusa AP103 TaxID=1172194 RepID=I8T4C8_9GAMM|nr:MULTISPECIES: DMT family transporter [Hydrocarboniphaga]EIT68558.1 drug/metabolite transporter (DMT) superfamily permease [Hydrocarboniphaga effusa AP103]MDZ4077092.1 DMT family transporter [Hydrocarboniphaga sp.]